MRQFKKWAVTADPFVAEVGLFSRKERRHETSRDALCCLGAARYSMRRRRKVNNVSHLVS